MSPGARIPECIPRFRVLHLRASLGLYGAERAIVALASSTASMGVEVELLCLHDPHTGPSVLCQHASAKGVRAEVLPSRGRLDPATIVRLARELTKAPMTILHAHGYKAQLLGLAASVLAPVRKVVTLHGYTGESLRVKAYEAVARATLSRFDSVVVVSRALEAGVLRAHPDLPVLHVPNRVDVRDIAGRTEACPVGLPETSRPVVLSVGRLSPEKGHRHLVLALARLPERTRPALCILGDGPLRDELAGLAKASGVESYLPGFVDDPAPYWKAATLLCLPSLTEGLPLAALEAMAAGLPLVTTRVGELPALLRDVPGAFLVPPGDPASLGAAVERCLALDKVARASLVEAQRAIVTERYDVADLGQEYISRVYLPLLGAARAPM